MTIDERLERLTERHEALTQTVELMLRENQEQGKRIDGHINRILGLIESLTDVAQSHERRLKDLEGK